MARLRYNGIGGKLSEDPLSSGATSLTNSTFASLPAINSPNYVAVVLDPDGVYGAPEIVWITAHVNASQTVTILRGQEGTIARSHYNDTYFIHGITAFDFDSTNLYPVADVAGKIYLWGNYS